MQSHTLRARLLGAVAAGVALVPACKAQEPAPVVAPAQSAVASAPAPSAPPPPSASAAAPAPPPGPRVAACEPDTKVERYCYAANKGPPRQVPNAHFTFDKQGCVSDDQVVNNCEGVHAVLSGPTMDGKTCCHQVCRGPIPPCGRPLLAEDRSARVAPTTSRGDWLGDRVDVVANTRLRDAWLEDAAAEHASVAAFARFTLELLAVGAPASLVADAQRAGLDEIEHARICYAVAAAYGDAPVGPAPLSLAGVELRSDLASIAAAAAEEACVGETFSALALAEARDNCTDPNVRRLLGQMSEDEARHAELGFRFVAWAIARGGEAVQAAVAAAFERALARDEHSLPSARDDAAWRAAGRLTERDRANVWRRASLEVIGPCLESMGSTFVS